MNLKKKMKAFFTMNRHANDGFTLVELIVVIAILAILAGVAVPAYSGYIEKANRAADEQLLSVVNTAFAAACAINGESNYYRNDVSASIVNKQFVYVEPFKTDFTSFFEDDAMEFNVISSLLYDAEFGGFKDPATATNLTLSYGGGFVNVSGEALNALKDSTFYGEGMTSEKLMNEVDRVAGVAAIMGSVVNVTATEAFANSTLASLGYTDAEIAGMTPQQKSDAMTAKARELALKNLGWTEDDVTRDNEYLLTNEMNRINGNALVLYTAQSTSNMSADEAKNMLNGVTSATIREAMTNGATDAEKAKGMNQAALAFGMYYAYVNSDQCTKNLNKNDIGANEVIDALDNNQEFQNYMASEQGTKDMNAYLQALGVISSSSNSPAAVEKLVSEGFASQDLIDILTQGMGK